jgi:hypothetical protein
MTKDLKELGRQVGHRSVGRLSNENGVEVKRNKEIDASTVRTHSRDVAPNLLNRVVHAVAPNQR